MVTAFATVGIIMFLSNLAAKYFTGGRIHGSAIAVVSGIVLAYIGGRITHGHKGVADLTAFSGFALMGGGPSGFLGHRHGLQYRRSPRPSAPDGSVSPRWSWGPSCPS